MVGFLLKVGLISYYPILGGPGLLLQRAPQPVPYPAAAASTVRTGGALGGAGSLGACALSVTDSCAALSTTEGCLRARREEKWGCVSEKHSTKVQATSPV